MRYRIEDILKNKKITIYQLSNITNLEINTLSRIVKNKVQGCSNKFLDKIARALNVSIDELFDRGDPSDEGSC